MSAGNALASFINANFSGALSLSFASHSLGARMVLQTIAGLSRSVRGLLLMAGAIDNTCLSSEYAAAASKVQSISLLASHSDDVLEWAFPSGNFVSGLFSRGVPYIHEAMGREGPAEPYPSPDNIHADWQIPDGWNFGHGQLSGRQVRWARTRSGIRRCHLFPHQIWRRRRILPRRTQGKRHALAARLQRRGSDIAVVINLRLVTLACPKAMEACWASELWRRRRNSRFSPLPILEKGEPKNWHSLPTVLYCF